MTAPPTPTGSAIGSEAGEGRPLWSSIRKQLYPSEVSTIKKLVGETLIRQNQVAWDELRSLRQMLGEFQQQNDELTASLQQSAQLCGSQHRELLRNQAQLLLESLRSKAADCNHTLEDLLPSLEERQLCAYVLGASAGPASWKGAGLSMTPPATPSTRPSSSSGWSSSTPEPTMPPVPLGRALRYEELGEVAAGIREALEGEHAALMAAIEEQTDLLEAEASRRADEVGRLQRAPSTAKLQRFCLTLQDLLVSPTLKTLACTVELETRASFSVGQPPDVSFALGGASARRLKALIAERRRDGGLDQSFGSQSFGSMSGLGTVPEVFDVEKDKMGPGSPCATVLSPAAGKPFDPFFDDPFT